MAPQDYLQLNILSFFLIAVYTAVFNLVLFSICKRFQILTTQSASLLAIGYLFFLFVGLTNSIFQFLQIPPDTVVYGAIILDPSQLYSYSIGVKTYAIINFIPFLLCFKQPVVFMTFSIFYYFMGMLLLWRGYWRLCTKNGAYPVSRNFLYIFILLITGYPMGIITIPTLLRESLMILSLGICMNIFSKLFYSIPLNSFNKFILSLAFLVLTGVRPVMGICFILSAWFSLNFFKPGKKISVQKIGRFLVIGVIVFLAMAFLVQFFYTITFTPAWLGVFRNAYIPIHGDEGYGYNMDWINPIRIMLNLILLFFQYLLSPAPFLFPLSVSMRKLLPWADIIYIVFLLLVIFFKNRLPLKKMLLTFAFISLFIPALFETHVTGASRHRMNGVVVFIPMAAYALGMASKKNNKV